MLLFFYYGLAFIGGLFIGSFLNVVADRLLAERSFIKGRSHCDHCSKPLGLKDLIPVLSFASLKGKCRYCKTRLSIYYPLSEILTGSLFVLMAVYSGVFQNFNLENHIEFVYLAIVASLYIVLTLTDFKEKIIPDKIVYFGIVVTFLFGLVSALYSGISYYFTLKASELGPYLIEAGFLTDKIMYLVKMLSLTYLSTAVIFLFFYFLIVITKGRGMGGGDLKLSIMIGLFNGFPLNIVAIFMGFVFGAVISLLMIFARRKSLKDTVAFGPFMVLGSIVALFYGDQILRLMLGN